MLTVDVPAVKQVAAVDEMPGTAGRTGPGLIVNGEEGEKVKFEVEV